MAAVVVDASILVDGFLSTAPASRLLRARAADRLDLVAPDLIFSESAHAIRKAVLRGVTDPAAADSAIERLARLRVFAVGTQRLLAAAWRYRDTMALCDATYAALAADTKLPLVTSDKRFATAASAAGIRVLTQGEDALEAFLEALGV